MLYELFKSNEEDESLFLIAADMDRKEAMIALKECNEPHCQVELFILDPKYSKEYMAIMARHGLFEAQNFAVTHGKYDLIATKHNGRITRYE